MVINKKQVLSLKKIRESNENNIKKIEDISKSRGIYRGINYKVHLLQIETMNTNSVLLLSQMLYWTTRVTDEEGYFYKSFKDWHAETGLKRKAFQTARKKLLDLGIIEMKLKGIPAISNYRVNLEIIQKLLNKSNTEPIVDKSEIPVEKGCVKKFENVPRVQTSDVPRVQTITETTSQEYKQDYLNADVDNFFNKSSPQSQVSDFKIKKTNEVVTDCDQLNTENDCFKKISADPPCIKLQDLTDPDTYGDAREYYLYDERSNFSRELYKKLLPHLQKINKEYDLSAVNRIVKKLVLRAKRGGRTVEFKDESALINYLVEVFKNEKTPLSEINNNPDWRPTELHKHWIKIGLIHG